MAAPAPTSDPAFEERMASAEASKQAGNAALAAGNPKSASFHYKKVYLYLAEYLPADMAASALASASASPPPIPKVSAEGDVEEPGMSDNDAANGLVGFLQQRRKAKLRQASQSNETSADDVAAEEARQQRLHVLYGTTLNNLTLAHYKLGRYREGVATATCLLMRVPGFELSPKALLRRGYCYVGLQEPLLAEVNANELDRIVTLAEGRCQTAAGEENEGEAPASTDAGDVVIDGLGGMTVAAVAAMKPEVAALKEAIASLKRASDQKEKKMYQKMFSSQ